MTELEPVALHRARNAFNRKWADMSSPFPTEEPEAGDGPIGYAIRAYLEAATANAALEERDKRIEELEPVAWRWAWKTTGSELEQRFADPDLYEWTYRDTPPSEGAAPKMDIEPLVTLSSAQSAIAERDARIAELERELKREAQLATSMAEDRNDAEARAEAAEVLLKEAKTEIERVLLFGGRMANACYNISRKLEVSSLDKRDLHFAQLEWDAETKPARSLASKIGGGE